MSRTWPSLEVRFLASAIDRDSHVDEAVATVLDDCPPTAVVENAERWLASYPTADARDRALALLAASLGDAVAVVPFEMADEDWAARSQAGIVPVRVGRIVVSPPWHAASVDRAPGDHLVVVVPSMGFGTGHHATTRLCLAALQSLALSGTRVADIGTGSGVLAMASAFLGAAHVLAIDDDPDAIEAACENIAANGLDGRVEVTRADFRALVEVRADVVIANLTGALLVQVAARLSESLAPHGHLIVSGFTTAERDAVVAALRPHLQAVREHTEEEWGVAVFSRPAGLAPPE